jgi:hypothetical protein
MSDGKDATPFDDDRKLFVWDTIVLSARTHYHSLQGLEGGYVGVYLKHKLVSVGPGPRDLWIRSSFRIELPVPSEASLQTEGIPVLYGSPLLLVDISDPTHPQTWNSNTSTWSGGYVAPKPKGAAGELVVCFRSPEKPDGACVLSDDACTVEVVGCTGKSSRLNKCTLRIFRKSSSLLRGGYVMCDGQSGRDLFFGLKRVRKHGKKKKKSSSDAKSSASAPGQLTFTSTSLDVNNPNQQNHQQQQQNQQEQDASFSSSSSPAHTPRGSGRHQQLNSSPAPHTPLLSAPRPVRSNSRALDCFSDIVRTSVSLSVLDESGVAQPSPIVRVSSTVPASSSSSTHTHTRTHARAPSAPLTRHTQSPVPISGDPPSSASDGIVAPKAQTSSARAASFPVDRATHTHTAATTLQKPLAISLDTPTPPSASALAPAGSANSSGGAGSTPRSPSSSTSSLALRQKGESKLTRSLSYSSTSRSLTFTPNFIPAKVWAVCVCGRERECVCVYKGVVIKCSSVPFTHSHTHTHTHTARYDPPLRRHHPTQRSVSLHQREWECGHV